MSVHSRALLQLAVTLAVAACSRGGATQRSAQLPHVPVYPGAQLIESVVAPERDPTEYYVVRDASAAEVLAWYKEQMPGAGWTASTDANDAFVIYHTAEGCYGFVAAYANADGSVELQLSEQAQGTPCQPYVTSEPGHD